MPTANWLNPQPTGYQPDPAPRGLFGFLGGGNDLGAEISDRGGVIAQILMNLGGNRGGAGIAEATANANARSDARRERRKAERMVARAADKIEGSNPEMAALMRANTEFGMQMLGKQYESDWNSKSRMAELQKEYELRGQNELALQQAKADAWKSDPLFSGLGGGGTPAAAATTPIPATLPAATSPMPDAGMAGGMGAGGGGEPAPSVLPTVTVQQPPPQQDPDPSMADPMSVKPPLFPVSDNPFVAQLQERFSPIVGAPRISAEAASAIWQSRTTGGVDTATALKNAGDEWKAHVIRYQDLAIARQNKQLDITTDAAKTQAANAYKEGEPARLEAAFRQGVSPTSGSRGPMTVGQKLPWEMAEGAGPSMDNAAILRAKGFDDQAIADMASQADPNAQAFLSAERAGGAQPATTAAQIFDDLRTARTAKTVADTAAQAGGGVAGASKAMADSIRAIPENQRTPEDTQDLAILDAAAAVAPVKPDVAGQMLGNLSTERRQRLDTLSQIEARKQKTAIDASTEARQVKAAKDAEEKVAKAEKDTFIRGVDNAKVVQKTVKKIGNIMYGGGGETASYDEGAKGWITGSMPGTARRAIGGLITTIKSQIANHELQAVRNASVSGASGYGQLTGPELELFQTQLNNLEIAAETGENLEQALKEVWNKYESMIHPTSGKRMDEDVPGFKMRDFNFEQDSPGLYEWALREGKLGDFVREDRAQFGNEDPLGLGLKPQGGVDPNDPLGLGPKPGRP
jgi:hypothetical protein